MSLLHKISHFKHSGKCFPYAVKYNGVIKCSKCGEELGFYYNSCGHENLYIFEKYSSIKWKLIDKFGTPYEKQIAEDEIYSCWQELIDGLHDESQLHQFGENDVETTTYDNSKEAVSYE